MWPKNVHSSWITATNDAVIKKSATKPVTMVEGWQFIAMELYMCSHAKKDLKQHFTKEMHKTTARFRNWLPRDRILNIYRHRSYDFEEMALQLKTQFASLVHPGTDHCVDEVIFHYCGDDPDVIYIKDKPHPEGYLCWTNVQRFEQNVPYLLNFVLRYPKGYYCTAEVVQELIATRRKDKTLVIADSWFPSELLHHVCILLGVNYLFAFSPLRYRYLWRTLNHRVMFNSYKQAYNPSTNDVAVFLKQRQCTRMVSNFYNFSRSTDLPRVPALKRDYNKRSRWGDQFNQYFYTDRWHNRQSSGPDAIFNGFLRFAVVNAFAIFKVTNNYPEVTFAAFQEELAMQMLAFKFE